ncbi:MAG: DNA ligase D [Chloroflexi bacterium]|nr:DNA ligase D [Chloroflexota bacterium]
MLEKYSGKRHFDKTPEPAPAAPVRGGERPLQFVVHKHSARRLHYDLRLELGGVLKSWAIPGGPSLDPRVKRLAVTVEDHPLEYASFEGTIPTGEYGAGPVIIWDRGDYSPEENDRTCFDERARAEELVRDGLGTGKLSLNFRGQKMRGSWALVKMQHGEKEWLLIKHRDEFASPDKDILKEEFSVLSGLGVQDMPAPAATGKEAPARIDLTAIQGAHPAPFPPSLSPMLATLTSRPFNSPDWIFEPKLDGYRCIALVRGKTVRLLSRRGLDNTARYPQIAASLRQPNSREMILDGEIVAMDELGRPCFQCLQQHLKTEREAGAGSDKGRFPIIYYVFDILFLDGYDLTAAALRRRKNILGAVFKASDNIRLLDYFPGDGALVYENAVLHGLEGVMAKRLDSTYEAGRRSRSWLKIKAVLSDDFVIGGYTQGQGLRGEVFGALLVGQYDEKDRLVYAGHVGTGFDEQTLAELKRSLDALRSDRCPFVETPPTNAPTTWVRPEMIAEVKFSEWTQDGRLRAPVFQRLREDKPAQDVRLTGPPSAKTALPLSQKGDTGGLNILHELQKPGETLSLSVEGYELAINNLSKELWPTFQGRPALAKRDLLIYLAAVSPYLLPHLRDRPITLKRYPEGIHGEYFYQKHWPYPLPEFVETLDLSPGKGETGQPYLLCNNLPTLLWLGQLANIELHTWFSRTSPGPDLPTGAAKKGPAELLDHPSFPRRRESGLPAAGKNPGALDYPDFIIIDLDPYIYAGTEARGAEPELNRAAFRRTCEVALWLKETLDSLSLTSFLKTSGRTGLHVYVPIVRRFDYHQVHAAAETIGRYLVQRRPKVVTLDWGVEKRTGMVFFDYNQNVYGKTLASVYSPRATPQATVSLPVSWDELTRIYPTDFTILTVPDRLAKVGDLWAHILESKSDLGNILAMQ